jgi:GTP-binding protein
MFVLKVLQIELLKKKTKGKIGEEFWIWLQLKVIADIGIVGLPNAGKSSLLASITKARPKIASYPFTTLDPNLGVSYYDNKEVTLADIPGLVEGAHKGVGLGDKFLRHIERCKILLHLIDLSEEDLLGNYVKIRNELSNYDDTLSKKKEIIFFNKSDLFDKKDIDKKLKVFKNKIKKKFEIVSVFSDKDLLKIKKILLKNVNK